MRRTAILVICAQIALFVFITPASADVASSRIHSRGHLSRGGESQMWTIQTSTERHSKWNAGACAGYL